MKILDYAIRVKNGSIKSSEVPQGVRKAVDRIVSDPAIDLSTYSEGHGRKRNFDGMVPTRIRRARST